MSKLDEAIIAAWEAFDASEGDMEQAIQAAVKVLVPDEAPRSFDRDMESMSMGHDRCRDQILENAGTEE